MKLTSARNGKIEMAINLILTNNPSPEELKILQQGLDSSNDKILKEHPQDFAFFIRNDSNEICGGIYSLVYSNAMHIVMLWVDESLRNQDLGSRLMKAAEEEAIKRNCQSAYVDTFAFQAKAFYFKNGYRCIGEIPDLLLGHSRFFFKKDLAVTSIENCQITLVNSTVAEKICREITTDLPEWFGIPEANERYARGMNDRISIIASIDNQSIGLITLEFPYPNNANIYWMAVKREFHGKKIGTKLLNAAVIYCCEREFSSITVETLSNKQADVNYLKTYKFYESMGFNPLFDLQPYGTENKMVYMLKRI